MIYPEAWAKFLIRSWVAVLVALIIAGLITLLIVKFS